MLFSVTCFANFTGETVRHTFNTLKSAKKFAQIMQEGRAARVFSNVVIWQGEPGGMRVEA